MDTNVKKLILLWSLLIFLPSIIFVGLSQSSYASGVLCSCIGVSVFYFIHRSEASPSKSFLVKKLIVFWGILFLVIVLHSFLVFVLNRSFEPFRAVGSLVIIGFMICVACLVVFLLNESPVLVFDSSLKKIIWIFVIIAFVSGVLDFAPLPIYRELNRQVFPFLEPSHFALGVAPYFLWILSIQTKVMSKILIIGSSLLLLAFINNLTLVCLILLGTGLSVRYYHFIIVLLIVFLFIYFSNIDLTYYTRRIDLSDSNMSTLVWIQGWEEAWINFGNTFGLGVGFQQFGVEELQGDAAQLLYSINGGEYLNRYDGGTFASKIIGEFGLLGVGIIIAMCTRIIKSIVFLKAYHVTSNLNKLLFYHCCIVYFCIEIAVRSTSYIAPGFFIFLVGLIGVKMEAYKQLEMKDIRDNENDL